jgi:hypothetical protein
MLYAGCALAPIPGGFCFGTRVCGHKALADVLLQVM